MQLTTHFCTYHAPPMTPDNIEQYSLATEIHAGAAQLLASAQLHFEAFDHCENHETEEAANNFSIGLKLLRNGLAEIRRLIGRRHSLTIMDEKLNGSIDRILRDYRMSGAPKIVIDNRIKDVPMAPVVVSSIVLIVQEGLANACKHSRSQEVRVALLSNDRHIRIEIEDRGIGFDAENCDSPGFGLQSIRNWARMLGGLSTIESAAGRGARIVVELPNIPPLKETLLEAEFRNPSIDASWHHPSL